MSEEGKGYSLYAGWRPLQELAFLFFKLTSVLSSKVLQTSCASYNSLHLQLFFHIWGMIYLTNTTDLVRNATVLGGQWNLQERSNRVMRTPPSEGMPTSREWARSSWEKTSYICDPHSPCLCSHQVMSSPYCHRTPSPGSHPESHT